MREKQENFARTSEIRVADSHMIAVYDVPLSGYSNVNSSSNYSLAEGEDTVGLI